MEKTIEILLKSIKVSTENLQSISRRNIKGANLSNKNYFLQT